MASEETGSTKTIQKLRQLRVGLVQVYIMSESIKYRNPADFRLFRIDFPGVNVK